MRRANIDYLYQCIITYEVIILIFRFNTNELQTEKKERAKEDLTAKIEDLEMTIKALTEAIDTLKSEIAEMQVQLKRAGEDREKENKEFQMTVADQRQYNRQF